MNNSQVNTSWTPPMRFLLRKNIVHKILLEEDVRGKSCLEMGYGAGEMLFLFSQLGLNVHGYDFSESAYSYTTERIKNGSSQETINIFQRDNEITNHSYDYLMAFEVLEHIEDDLDTLKRWRDRLSNGGKMILSIPAHQGKWGESDELVGHYRRYERKGLHALFQSAGMKVNKIYCYGYPLTLILDPLLNRWAAKKLKTMAATSKEDLSKESSLYSKSSLTMRLLSNDITLFPFYMMQRLLLNTDIGSGYIVVAEK